MIFCVVLFLGLPFSADAQIDKLKQKVKSKTQSLMLIEEKKENEKQENNVNPSQENSSNKNNESSSAAKEEQVVPVAEEVEENKVILPDYFSTPSHKFDDKEITEKKIIELFKKFDRNCEDILKIWIGDLDRSEEWHTFTHDTGIPDFMRTNRYFSIVFKGKDGKCYYTWNNLAMCREYMGNGNFSEMKLMSVKYKKIEIDCSEVK